jgi:hypothetical protein
MPPPKYMELVVYRKAQGGLPMIKHTIKLSDLDLNALSIRDLMRDFIQKLRPNFEYLDSEIVYVKTGGGSVVGSDLFDEPAADLEQMIDSGEKWKLEVRIDAQATMGRPQGAENNNGIFQIQVRANEKKYLRGSQFSYEDLTTFLEGCNQCATLAVLKAHLRELGGKKMAVDVQVETLLNHFLETSKLGYRPSDPTTKTQLLNARNRLGNWLLFVRKNLPSICVNNKTTINGNPVLKMLESLVVTGVNEIGKRKERTSRAELQQKLEAIEKEKKENKRCWPGYFYNDSKKDKTKKVGQPIIDLEEAIFDVIQSTIGRLDSEADRTARRGSSVLGPTRPDHSNSTYDIRSSARYISCAMFCRIVLLTRRLSQCITAPPLQVRAKGLPRLKAEIVR